MPKPKGLRKSKHQTRRELVNRPLIEVLGMKIQVLLGLVVVIQQDAGGIALGVVKLF